MALRSFAKIFVKLFIGALLVAGIFWLVRCQCVNIRSLTPAALRDFIQSFGRLAVLVYIIAYALNTISIIPPIAALSLAAGLAFGEIWGAVYLMAGAMLGTSATFMIARYFGRGLIEKILKGRFKDLDERLAKNGFMTILFFRVIPLVPYEILNYAGGLSLIKFKDYFFATFLGLIPGVIVSAFFGGSLGGIKTFKDIFAAKFLIAAGLMILILAVPPVYQAIKKRRRGRASSMIKSVFVAAILVFCTAFEGYGQGQIKTVPNVVTEDIQAGIEKYIAEQTARGGGYFKFSSGGKEYLFKLVRVHTEYLANLGPSRHFACVDLVDSSGDVYDVDFFLAGEPGAMTVTETTLHKLNGIPFYTWEQTSKGAWRRVPIKGARPKLLGVIKGRDEFDFLYRVKLPEITGAGRMWLPLPLTDAFQKVEIISVDLPKNQRILQDDKYGNKAFFFELGAPDSGKTFDIRYHIQRVEKAAYAAKADEWRKGLGADRLVPINDNFRNIAEKAVEGKKGDIVRARALYDYVIDNMRYMKYGPGWGKGDAVYACNVQTGNCSDYHSYFISLARAVGIPARFAVGAAIPSERNDGGVDGYHCWAEFYADGKWWPVDISEADKYSSLATYYFGHHPANRLEFSRGRDLVFEPGPAWGPVNFFAYPVLEIDGKPAQAKVTFSFRRKQI